MKSKGFTLIELLVVLAILIILAVLALIAYNKLTKTAECSGNKEQHRKVVNLAKETYNFCRLNGSTNMNLGPGLGCRDNLRSGLTAKGVDSSGKCIRRWDCKSDYLNRRMTAGLSRDWLVDHVRAEFKQPANTSGFVRGDQWQNFIKPNYPERPGITNIRDKGDDLHIATYLGPDCSGGDFTNSSGSYLIDEIKWP